MKSYRVYLCGVDFTLHEDDCPGSHTPKPSGYIKRADWSARMLKTHDQRQCSVCGLWAIWVSKVPT